MPSYVCTLTRGILHLLKLFTIATVSKISQRETDLVIYREF